MLEIKLLDVTIAFTIDILRIDHLHIYSNKTNIIK